VHLALVGGSGNCLAPRGVAKWLTAGVARDLTGLVPDIGGAVLSDAGLAMLRGVNAGSLPKVPEGARLGPCVAGTGKFICIGLNYSDHAAETGAWPCRPNPSSS
jgi:2-keto-4-pentenoate hydratase/2-oxohepta-3-ene-1,7-dioic acid hydratase in catechol pathway